MSFAIHHLKQSLGRGEGEVVKLRSERSRSLDCRVLEVAVDGTADALRLEAKERRDIAVGCSAAVAASTGAVGLRNGRASALAAGEAAAALLAVGVGRAGLEDGALALLASCRSRSCRCSGSGGSGGSGRDFDAVEVGGKGSGGLDIRVLEVGVDRTSDAGARETEHGCDVAVRGGGAVAASARAVALGNRGTGALAGAETAASLLAVRVLGAGTRYELVSTALAGIARGELVSRDADSDEGESDKGSRELHDYRLEKVKSCVGE